MSGEGHPVDCPDVVWETDFCCKSYESAARALCGCKGRRPIETEQEDDEQ